MSGDVSPKRAVTAVATGGQSEIARAAGGAAERAITRPQRKMARRQEKAFEGQKQRLEEKREAREEEAEEAQVREVEQQRKRRGRASTILTGPQGALGSSGPPQGRGASDLLGR